MSGYKNKNDKMSRKQYTGFRALLKNPWIFAGSALLLDTVMVVVGLILANLHPEVEYTLTADSGICILEHGLAGEHSAESLADSAGAGFHLHVGGHPCHSALFALDGLSALKINDYDGQRLAFDLIPHKKLLFIFKSGNECRFIIQ